MYHGFHDLEIVFDGYASPAALMWLMRQSVRMDLALLTETDATLTSSSGGWRDVAEAQVAKMRRKKTTTEKPSVEESQ
jgi:hypothetical protein